MSRLRIAFLICGLLICPRMFGQSVKVNWNAHAQFSGYKTYSWKAAKNPGNPLFGQWVQPDVDDQLRARGLQFLYPGQTPDLLVIYSVQAQEKMHSTTTMEGYGWGDGPWAGFGGWGGMENEAEGLPPVATYTTEQPRMIGILTIDIVDGKKKQIIWRGQATVDCMSKSDSRDEKQVLNAVQKMFKKYPPS
jgi:Domain of unknown function (DUF4136)